MTMPIEGAFHAHSGWQFKRDPERYDHSLEVVMFKDGQEVARFDSGTWASIYASVSSRPGDGDLWHQLLRIMTGWPPTASPTPSAAAIAPSGTPEQVAQLAAGSHLVVIDFLDGVMRERVLPMGAPMGRFQSARQQFPKPVQRPGVPPTITVAEYRARQGKP